MKTSKTNQICVAVICGTLALGIVSSSCGLTTSGVKNYSSSAQAAQESNMIGTLTPAAFAWTPVITPLTPKLAQLGTHAWNALIRKIKKPKWQVPTKVLTESMNIRDYTELQRDVLLNQL